MKNSTKLVTDKSMSDTMPKPQISTEKDEKTSNAVDMHIQSCTPGGNSCTTVNKS